MSKLKLFALIVTLSFASASMAHHVDTVPTLQLRHDGFADAVDSTKRFIVVDVPEFSKEALYSATLTHLNSVYRNPQRVITSVENEAITVNAVTRSIIGDLDWYVYEVAYTVNLQFRDGRFRVDARINGIDEYRSESRPPVKCFVSSADSADPHEINAIWVVGAKTGEPILLRPVMKANIDAWIRAYVNEIVSAVKDSDW